LQDPTTPQQETFQGVNSTVVSLSGNVNVAVAGSNATTTANVNVRFYVFNDEGKITYGTKVRPLHSQHDTPETRHDTTLTAHTRASLYADLPCGARQH
jgi:phage gp45-like